VKVIGELRTLLHLNLEANQLSDAGVARLASLDNLRTLGLAGNADVTDESFRAFTSLPALTSLDLAGTGITDQGLAALRAALPTCRIDK